MVGEGGGGPKPECCNPELGTQILYLNNMVKVHILACHHTLGLFGQVHFSGKGVMVLLKLIGDSLSCMKKSRLCSLSRIDEKYCNSCIINHTTTKCDIKKRCADLSRMSARASGDM